MRSILTAAAAAVLLTALGTPSDAAGTMTCTIYYDRPTGFTTGTGYCGATTLNFTANNGCPTPASGTMSGGLNGNFNWTRLGVSVVMTMSGGGNSVAYGLATSPCPASGEPSSSPWPERGCARAHNSPRSRALAMALAIAAARDLRESKITSVGDLSRGHHRS